MITNDLQGYTHRTVIQKTENIKIQFCGKSVEVTLSHKKRSFYEAFGVKSVHYKIN